MEKSRKGPKKGAAKKWAEKLKKLREQPPSEELMKILDRAEKPKKIASTKSSSEGLA